MKEEVKERRQGQSYQMQSPYISTRTCNKKKAAFHTEILVKGGTEQGQSLGVVLPPDAK